MPQRKLVGCWSATLASLAFLCLGGATARAAGEFTWSSTSPELIATSTATQVFTTTAGKVECNELAGKVDLSSLSPPAPEVTTGELRYRNNLLNKCKGPLGTEPTVEMHGCQLTLRAGSTLPGEIYETEGSIGIVCGKTAYIEFHSVLCTVDIRAQSVLTTVKYETVFSTNKFVNVILEVHDLAYTHEGLCGSGSGVDGTYTGGVKLVADLAGNVKVE